MTTTRAALPRRRFLGLSAAGTLAALGDCGLLAHLPPVASAEAKVDPRACVCTPRSSRSSGCSKTRRASACSRRSARGSAAGTSYRECSPRCCWPACGTSSRARSASSSTPCSSSTRRTSRAWPRPTRIAGCRSSGPGSVQELAGRRRARRRLDVGAGRRGRRPAADKARAAFIDAMEAGTSRRPTRRSPGSRARRAPARSSSSSPATARATSARSATRRSTSRTASARSTSSAGSTPSRCCARWRTRCSTGRRLRQPVDERPAGGPPVPAQPAIGQATSRGLARRPRERGGDARDAPRAAPGDAGGREHAALNSLNRGVAPQSIFEACFVAPASCMMRAAGDRRAARDDVHQRAALRVARSADDETRRLLLLQNAAFLPLFRGEPGRGVAIDTLEPLPPPARARPRSRRFSPRSARDRAGRRAQGPGLPQTGGDARPLADAARRLMFLKGTDSHDYKYSSAVLEDAPALAASCRARMLAAGAFYFKGCVARHGPGATGPRRPDRLTGLDRRVVDDKLPRCGRTWQSHPGRSRRLRRRWLDCGLDRVDVGRSACRLVVIASAEAPS